VNPLSDTDESIQLREHVVSVHFAAPILPLNPPSGSRFAPEDVYAMKGQPLITFAPVGRSGFIHHRRLPIYGQRKPPLNINFKIILT
jgi:hypothetical protein